MPLELCIATPSDAPRIAEIHMAAFGSNALLHGQFPSVATRAQLQISIEQKALADIMDAKISVLVVRDINSIDRDSDSGSEEGLGGSVDGEHKGGVISFAKWEHPVAEGEEYEEPAWIWPEESVFQLIDDWTRKTEDAQEKVLGNRPCFHLSFMATDPPYERRGAASLLLRWGMEQCKTQKVFAYLESTIEAAPLYEKHGFVAVDRLSIDVEEMSAEETSVEGTSKEKTHKTYREICFLGTFFE